MNFLSKVKKLLIYIRYFYLICDIRKLNKKKLDIDECVVLGNGPSLRQSFKENMKFIKSKEIFCLNNFAKSEYFTKLKPKHYVLADPLFFDPYVLKEMDKLDLKRLDQMKADYNNRLKEGIISTFQALIKKTTWKLFLYVPIQSKPGKVFETIRSKNSNIQLIYYSTIPINISYSGIRHLIYHFGIGMPTPQTVIIAAIHLAVQWRFRNVYLFGADHTWHEELYLTDENVLCFTDKHFYSNQSKGILTPLVENVKTGKTTMIHEFFYNSYLVFRSHLLLNKYSKASGVKIVNCSEKTWIDSYNRGKCGK